MKNLYILFAPFGLAILAKENGFNEPCLAYYEQQRLSDVVEFGNSKLRQENLINGCCLAPMYQQLVDWLRDGSDLVVWVDFNQDVCKYTYQVISKTSKSPFVCEGGFDNYYEALEKAIGEALRLIKK